MLAKALSAATAAAAEKLYVEDVFSTWLYTGNGSTQTITNGIDLSGEGGLVWIKSRSDGSGHFLCDTARGAGQYLRSNTTAANTNDLGTLSAFNASGFNLSSDVSVNFSSSTYASWTFRKAAKFFDVVTYTGDGNASKTISHNLGSTPGFLIVKRTDSTGQWQCYHRGLTSTNYYIQLNQTTAQQTLGSQVWGVSSTNFTVYGAATDTNINGATYVAYLFAHDAGGFGDSGNESVVSCGSYTGNGSTTGPTVTLGWEPQWLMIKNAGSTGDWNIFDNMRGITVGGDERWLSANLTNAESAANVISLLPTGFQVVAPGAQANTLNNTYIYIAIRRGPMKTPTDATKVFQAKVYTGTNTDNRLVTTDIVTDMTWARERDGSTQSIVVADRLRGQPYLRTSSSGIEINDANSFDQELVGGTEYGTAFSSMSGFWIGNDATSNINVSTTSNGHIAYAFRRAPGFFDVVAYTGTGVNRTVSHNLGVVPELMVVKRRTTSANSWAIYTSNLGATQYLSFDAAAGAVTLSTVWNDTQPTASQFTVGILSWVNASNNNYIAYLFATCPGVSKVGSYTGTGTTQQIDCGFAAGARFVLIKRTDSAGEWYVWDTARGIISGDDPYFWLNSTAAEVTNTDYIDPLNSGFEISSTAPAAINANGGSFVFFAIA